jgi:hypothetical protein
MLSLVCLASMDSNAMPGSENSSRPGNIPQNQMNVQMPRPCPDFFISERLGSSWMKGPEMQPTPKTSRAKLHLYLSRIDTGGMLTPVMRGFACAMSINP